MYVQFECNFAMVDHVLSKMHNIDSDHRSAFANRLKHLQRLGYPLGTNTGRGRAATYRAQHFFLLGLALELAQLGLATDSAIPIIYDNMKTIAAAADRQGDERNAQ